MDDYQQMYGFGSYPVTIINNYIHHLKDGTHIAMRLWLPWLPSTKQTKLTDTCYDVQVLYRGTMEGTDQSETFPVIMEYIPYVKDSTGFLDRDYGRHSWFASHGYVCCRPDMRGSGVSGGLLEGEYTHDEWKDGIELIDWLGMEGWCNGNVGMYGKSWGGFNGLQLAYLQPTALKTVISLYSTDNRYTDDVHYKGDCMIGNVDGMVGWAGVMQAYQARPPVPKYSENENIEEWKKIWLERLKKQSLWLKDWVANQRKTDPFWRHGSIDEDYTKIICPVLIIGGLLDPYHNAAFRMAAYLNDESKAIIGPWPHQWPDYCQQGPNIDYLNVCLEWWDRHLKGIVRSTSNPIAESVDKWPRLQVFMQESQEPDPNSKTMPGYWRSLNSWDKLLSDFMERKSSSLSNKTEFVLAKNSLLVPLNESSSSESLELDLTPNLYSGLHCGGWIGMDRGDLPSDQTLDNQFSTVFESDPLQDKLTICGFSRVYLTVESLNKNSQVSVRVCHQLKSGKSKLISFGIQHFQEQKLKTEICIELNSTTYVVPKGDSILIAFSPIYFPMIIPSKDTMSGNTAVKTIIIRKSLVQFQTPSESENSDHNGFSKPNYPLLKIPHEVLAVSDFEMFCKLGLNREIVSAESQSSTGLIRYPDHDLIHQGKDEDSIEMDSNFQSCIIRSHRVIDQTFPKYDINTKVEADIEMEVTCEKFVIRSKLITKLNDNVFYSDVSSETVDRVSC